MFYSVTVISPEPWPTGKFPDICPVDLGSNRTTDDSYSMVSTFSL